MTTFLLILLAFLLILSLIGLFFLYKKMIELQKPQAGEENLFVMLQSQIQDLNKTVDTKLSETHKNM